MCFFCFGYRSFVEGSLWGSGRCLCNHIRIYKSLWSFESGPFPSAAEQTQERLSVAQDTKVSRQQDANYHIGVQSKGSLAR